MRKETGTFHKATPAHTLGAMLWLANATGYSKGKKNLLTAFGHQSQIQQGPSNKS